MDSSTIDFQPAPFLGGRVAVLFGSERIAPFRLPFASESMARLSQQFRRQLEEATASLERAQALLTPAPSKEEQQQEWLNNWSRWTD